MKYMKSVCAIESLIIQIIDKLEIERSQLEIMFDKLVADDVVDEKEKAKRFDEVLLPMRIAFDYFCEIERLSREIERHKDSLFDERAIIEERLAVLDSAEMFVNLNGESKELVKGFIKGLS